MYKGAASEDREYNRIESMSAHEVCGKIIRRYPAQEISAQLDDYIIKPKVIITYSSNQAFDGGMRAVQRNRNSAK